MAGPRFKLKPSQAAVLMHNIVTCEDADNDADRTLQELIAEIDSTSSPNYVHRDVLESALYCANMNDEVEKFWHPEGHGFVKFLRGILSDEWVFDRYYNLIQERDKYGTQAQEPTE